MTPEVFGQASRIIMEAYLQFPVPDPKEKEKIDSWEERVDKAEEERLAYIQKKLEKIGFKITDDSEELFQELVEQIINIAGMSASLCPEKAEKK